MKIINRWVERDLSDLAQEGRLSVAYHMDGVVQTVGEILESGRFPILMGEPGVGKTAVVEELVRRSHAGHGPRCLVGKRILQISLKRRASALRHPHEINAEMQKLIEALKKHDGKLALFIHDIHWAFHQDLEAELRSLAFSFQGPVIGEGSQSSLESMMEYDQGLLEYFSLVTIEEPSVRSAERILTAWTEEQERTKGRKFSKEAVDQALTLTHRFLARSRLPRKALELLDQTETLIQKGDTVTGQDVVNHFCASHQTPRMLLDSTISLDLRALEDQFSAEVMGQPEAVRAVVCMLGAIKAGLADARRPFGAFLFVGPSGVGKTHFAQVLTGYLFGSSDRMIRLNMADFQEESDADVLFGNPVGEGRRELRGVLTHRLMGHPFAVLLLDEFEKAHKAVRDRFLQLIDEGSFINGAGETISCRSTILIATSNAGAKEQRSQGMGFVGEKPDGTGRGYHVAMEKYFRFELLNRFDRIVRFAPLSRGDVRAIALRELDRLQDRSGIKQRELSVDAEDAVLDWITQRGFDPDHGARLLRRTIERHITSALAEFIVREDPIRGSRLRLSIQGDRIIAELVDRDWNPELNNAATPAALAPADRAVFPCSMRKRTARLIAAVPKVSQ